MRRHIGSPPFKCQDTHLAACCPFGGLSDFVPEGLNDGSDSTELAEVQAIYCLAPMQKGNRALRDGLSLRSAKHRSCFTDAIRNHHLLVSPSFRSNPGRADSGALS